MLFRGVLFLRFVQYSLLHFLEFPSSFFSIGFVSVHVVHPYSSIYAVTAWKRDGEKDIFV